MKNGNFFLAFCIVVIATSCRSTERGWQLLVRESAIHLGASTNYTDIALTAGLFPQYMLYLQGIDSQMTTHKIDLPYAFPDEICIADGKIWVIQAAQERENIASYDLEAGAWRLHPDLAVPKRSAGCTVSSKDEIVIWSQNKLVIAPSDHKGFVAILPDTEEIADVTKDASGKLWLVTRDGALYRQDEDEQWDLVKKFDLPREAWYLIVTVRGEVWIGTLVHLYVWSSLDSSSQLRLIEEIDQNILINLDICDDSQGDLWIATSKGLQVYTEMGIKSVALPEGRGSFFGFGHSNRQSSISELNRYILCDRERNLHSAICHPGSETNRL